MERRNFIKIFTAGMLACSIKGETSLAADDDNMRRIAITIDDPNNYQTPLMSPEDRNQAILGHLDKYNLKAALFVCGERIDNPAGKDILEQWNRAGHTLGNHSYSHAYYHSPKIDAPTYINDIIQCEKLIANYSGFKKRFRYPFLKEGNTVEKRDSVRKFLADNGYKHGYVSVDASDWYIDDRMKKRLKENPHADLQPYKKCYLGHMLERAEYYGSLAQRVLGRTIDHTLLMHHNLLNALFLDDLLAAFKGNGWRLIDASAAFADPVYNMEPNIIPAGESIVWGLAKESGQFEESLRYPGEDGCYEEAQMNQLGL